MSKITNDGLTRSGLDWIA